MDSSSFPLSGKDVSEFSLSKKDQSLIDSGNFRSSNLKSELQDVPAITDSNPSQKSFSETVKSSSKPSIRLKQRKEGEVADPDAGIVFNGSSLKNSSSFMSGILSKAQESSSQLNFTGAQSLNKKSSLFSSSAQESSSVVSSSFTKSSKQASSIQERSSTFSETTSEVTSTTSNQLTTQQTHSQASSSKPKLLKEPPAPYIEQPPGVWDPKRDKMLVNITHEESNFDISMKYFQPPD